ncbi:MAG: cAMP-binding protein [Gemmatimonadetes bacterium]|nr:cAMP-binding protein [Gemmatimonadota bacterium]
MSARLASREYSPLAMEPEARARLAQEYVDIVSQVFLVKDRERLFNNIARAQPDVLKIRIFRNAAGQVVGFFKVTVDYGERNGRKFAAFNSHAGFLRAYRGGSSTITLGLKTLLAEMLRHPNRDIFYVGMLLHPSSYSLFTRYAIEYWPRWDQPTPPEQVAFMRKLADVHASPESIYDPAHPLVRGYYIGTKTLEQEEAYWRSSERETVKYFLRVNPHYTTGAGIFTWIKLDGRLFRKTLRAVIGGNVQKTLLSVRGAAMKTRIGKAILPKPDVSALLRTVPLLAGLADPAIATLASAAEVISVKGGTTLVRQGEPGDAMYAISQGSAYVLLPSGADEQVVDQLGRGDIFGEMALLTGEPRSATVRSATALVAVRITRSAFESFLRVHPAIEEELWALYGQRRFDVYLRNQDRFTHLGRAERIAWFDGGEHRVMEGGSTIALPATHCVFVVTGKVEMNAGDGWAEVSAPALIESGAGFEIRSAGAARVRVLDTSPRR